MVGTLLLLHQERGLRIEELVARTVWLQELVVARGGCVLPGGDPLATVNEVIERIMSGSSAGHVSCTGGNEV